EREARAELDGDKAVGRLRIGLPDDYVDAYLRPLIVRFAEEHPRVEIEVHCELSKRIEPAVAAGELDLAVITQDPGRPKGERLRREPLVWVAARGHRPELSEVLPLGLFNEGCRARPRILNALQAAERPHRLVFSSSHMAGLLSAVEAGLCVTAITQSAAPASLRRLEPSENLPSLFELSVALVIAPQAGIPARHFAQALREAMAAPRLVA
ncbi:MAG: LysR family transcriptional regulator, partial [Hyphomicrobiales bacterium]